MKMLLNFLLLEKKNPLELVRLVFPIKKQARYSQENLALVFWEIDGMHLHNMIFPRNLSPKKKERKRYVTTSNNTDLHQQGFLQLGILKRRFVVSRALHVLARWNSHVLQLSPLLIIIIKKKNDKSTNSKRWEKADSPRYHIDTHILQYSLYENLVKNKLRSVKSWQDTNEADVSSVSPWRDGQFVRNETNLSLLTFVRFSNRAGSTSNDDVARGMVWILF